MRLCDYFSASVILMKYVAVQGYPKKTNVGELSVVPTEIRLLAPCYHSIPAYHGLKDVDNRYRKRYLDLMINNPVRQRFILRSKVFGYSVHASFLIQPLGYKHY